MIEFFLFFLKITLSLLVFALVIQPYGWIQLENLRNNTLNLSFTLNLTQEEAQGIWTLVSH